MKIIAMYLPQFHRVAENDAWWGEGFTDWVSSSEAKPVFEGHYQPHVPLNKNYYDLLDKKTMVWQAGLMKQYGIDGLCFYHYWFEKGQKILEKPAENLREWKDVEMPFCFSWANETWARSWAGIKGANVWSELTETQDGLGDGVLFRQDYGNRKDWEEHFMYLLPFFKDDRYIKIDNKPVFMIYKMNQIHCIGSMLECWRELASENGLDGIYIIAGNGEGVEKGVADAHYYHEPVHANRKVLQGMYGDGVKRLLYTEVWNEILLSDKGREKTYFSGFVAYDDSPRRGKHGVVIENNTPQLFGGFLAQLLAKNEANGNDLTFINAWNEWGEGMHLEPDEKYGYEYLEQINLAKRTYKDLIHFYAQTHIKDQEDRNEKHELYLNDLDKWMVNRERGLNIGDWLTKNGFNDVAVYGCGIMGRHLIRELIDDKNVKLSYIIDKERQVLKADVNCFVPGETLPWTDVVIISSYYHIDSIKDVLPRGLSIISLRDIILEQFEGGTDARDV